MRTKQCNIVHIYRNRVISDHSYDGDSDWPLKPRRLLTFVCHLLTTKQSPRHRMEVSRTTKSNKKKREENMTLKPCNINCLLHIGSTSSDSTSGKDLTHPSRTLSLNPANGRADEVRNVSSYTTWVFGLEKLYKTSSPTRHRPMPTSSVAVEEAERAGTSEM